MDKTSKEIRSPKGYDARVNMPWVELGDFSRCMRERTVEAFITTYSGLRTEDCSTIGQMGEGM